MEEVLNVSSGLRRQFWEEVYRTFNTLELNETNDYFGEELLCQVPQVPQYSCYWEESFEETFEKDLEESFDEDFVTNWHATYEESYEDTFEKDLMRTEGDSASLSDILDIGVKVEHLNKMTSSNNIETSDVEDKTERKVHAQTDEICDPNCGECVRIRKGKAMISNLLNEMLETERLYVEALQEVCAEYLPTKSSSLARSRSRSDPCLKLTSGRIRRSGQVSLNNRYNRVRRGSIQENSTDKKLLTASICLVQAPLQTQGSQTVKLSDLMEDVEENQENEEKAKKKNGEIKIKDESFKLMLGNIKNIKELHEKVILPGLEQAKENSSAIRDLFTNGRVCSKLKAEYGKYCINRQTSWQVLAENKQSLNKLRLKKRLQQDLSSQLQKPVQRLLKYHLFFTKLSDHSSELDLHTMAKNFSLTTETILEIQCHTNTMMWVGQTEQIPQGLDLTRQGDLIKDGKVLISGPRRSWGFGSRGLEPAHLVLFKQTVLVCCVEEKRLIYKIHISMNQTTVSIIEDEGCLFELRQRSDEKQQFSPQTKNLQKSEKNKKDVVIRVGCQNKKERDEWLNIIQNELKKLEDFAIQLGNPLV